jgi:hypothetical protein
MLIGIVVLVGLAALSMIAQEATGDFRAPLLVATVWFLVFWRTYRVAGIHRRKVLWLLLLAPFALCYPAWIAITSEVIASPRDLL